jgi:hypothetical protein
MFEALKDIKENDRVGDFLFPSLPSKIKGKVSFLSEEMVVVDSEVDGEVYQYITHPNNVCIVQKKA